MRQSIAAILEHVGEMERQLDRAVDEMHFMRRELSHLQYEQDHPAAGMLRRTGEKMSRTINAARERLDSLKTGIVAGCKNALAAFREKGIKALNNLAGFFHLKNGFQALCDSAEDGVKAAEESIVNLEAAAREYHEAGLHLRNMGRAMSGKEAALEAKPVGKVAKVLEAPIKLQRACCAGIAGSAENAIHALERLEQTAAKSSVTASEAEMGQSAVTPQSERTATTMQESSASPGTSQAVLRQQEEAETPEMDEDEDMEQAGGFCMAM